MMDAQEIAERSAASMWAQDHASQWLGMDLVEIAEGRSVITLKVEQHHVNGRGTCHGGITYALADSAFAFACNSRNQVSIGQHSTITYIAPAHKGDCLTARAVEVNTTGRNSIYDVKVVNQNDALVVEFRGYSRTGKGQHFDPQNI